MLDLPDLHRLYDPDTGAIQGAQRVERRLTDLRGIFADEVAYEAALAAGNPIVYTVDSIEPAAGEGDLHYGIGTILPGRIGTEFFMTKGHLHSWRSAAEVYIGLAGIGAMLLEEEQSGNSRLVPLGANDIVYVPGHVAHRTINTGAKPLRYIGVFPARAGHDYAAIAERNFRKVVMSIDGRAVLLDRDELGLQVVG